MQRSIILTNFCNPEIPGLGRCQSGDSGLAKTAGIPGLQSLHVSQLSFHILSVALSAPLRTYLQNYLHKLVLAVICV